MRCSGPVEAESSLATLSLSARTRSGGALVFELLLLLKKFMAWAVLSPGCALAVLVLSESERASERGLSDLGLGEGERAGDDEAVRELVGPPAACARARATLRRAARYRLSSDAVLPLAKSARSRTASCRNSALSLNDRRTAFALEERGTAHAEGHDNKDEGTRRDREREEQREGRARRLRREVRDDDVRVRESERWA